MTLIRWLAFGFAFLAMASSASLAIQHFSTIRLPGCGADQACEQLTSGPWSRIGGIPVSFLGVVWFSGFAFTLLPEGQNLPSRSLLAAAGCGLPVSLGFVSIMIWERKFCPWCFLTHSAGCLMFGSIWWLKRSARQLSEVGHSPGRNVEFRWLQTFVPTIAIAAVILGVLQSQHAARLSGQQQSDVRQMIARLTGQWASAGSSAITPVSITGRNRTGQVSARWQVVVFHDFACADCRNLHRNLSGFLSGRSDVAISYRHFPLCSECNPEFFSTENPDSGEHRQSCQAARLVEAAAQLHGPPGFELMSDWLFDRKGRFDQAELDQTVSTWGWNLSELLTLSDSDAVHALISDDVQLGHSLELTFTPTVWINGYPLIGEGSTSDRLAAVLAGLK